MFAMVQKIDSKVREPSLDRWANDIRLMREADKRTDEEIRATFAWANDDDFWKANILSPGKLREKFTTLLGQQNRNGGSTNGKVRHHDSGIHDPSRKVQPIA
jgi:hypothetical protein